MSIERQIIEAVDDGELFAHDLSMETVEKVLTDNGWIRAHTTGGHHRTNRGEFEWINRWINRWMKYSPPYNMILILYHIDPGTQQITPIRASAIRYGLLGHKDILWFAPDLNTPSGFGKFEEYMNNPEDWLK